LYLEHHEGDLFLSTVFLNIILWPLELTFVLSIFLNSFDLQLVIFFDFTFDFDFCNYFLIRMYIHIMTKSNGREPVPGLSSANVFLSFYWCVVAGSTQNTARQYFPYVSSESDLQRYKAITFRQNSTINEPRASSSLSNVPSDSNKVKVSTQNADTLNENFEF
jgi:hypothetical protein